MILKKLKLVSDGEGKIFLPRNKAIIKEIRHHQNRYRTDCSDIEDHFELFKDAGWIRNVKVFNSEGGDYYAFKTKNLRVYGLVLKSTTYNVFIISKIFIKQGKSKEHNQAINSSKDRIIDYEDDINAIREDQKKDAQTG